MRHASGKLVKSAAALAAFAALSLSSACSSPEERLERYLKSGNEYLEQERFGQANIQFLNALKIDEENVPALQGLASIFEQQADYQKMFGVLQRIVRLDPKNVEAKLDLAKLHLLANDAKSSLEQIDAVLAAAPQNAEALAVKAAVMFRLRNTAEALELANAALKIDPLSQEATAVLASERVEAKDFEAALKILDEAIAKDPKAPVLHLLRVQVLGNLGRTDDINAAFESLIAAYPEEVNYRRLYTTKLIEQEKLEAARAQLVEVAKLVPRQREAKLDIVRIDYRIGGKEKAEETLRSMIAEADEDDAELKFALGAFLREQQDYKAADAVYHEILRKKGADLDDILRAKNEMAALYLLQGKRDLAEKLISEVLAADSKNPDALVKRAGLKIDDGDIDEAIGDLRVVVNEHPDSVSARLLLAAAFETKGDLALAESELAQAVETSERGAQASNLFAKYLLRHGDTARAEQVLAESIALDPSSAENLKLLAAIRLRNQNWRGAEEAAAALRAVDEKDGDVSRILAAAYSGLKDYAGAIDILRKENERAPLDAQPLSTLIQAYLDSGQADEAEAFLKQTVEKNPSYYEARILLAQVQRRADQNDAAIETLQQAMELEPLRSEAYESLYGLYALAGRREEAGAVIERATDAIPDSDGLQILKADHFIATKQPDEAIAIYETILARRPDDLIVANNLASLLSERDDRESLARAAEAAAALKGSDNPYFLDTYGWALYRAGRAQEGIAALEKAAKAAPALVDARYHLGVALMETGETARGADELRAVIDAPAADVERVADARRRIAEL